LGKAELACDRRVIVDSVLSRVLRNDLAIQRGDSFGLAVLGESVRDDAGACDQAVVTLNS